MGDGSPQQFKYWFSVGYLTQVQSIATVKLEICFDIGQFAGRTKNLQDQWAVVILHAKKFVDD